MGVDEDSVKNVDLASLDMSVWVFKEGFCRYVISIKFSCASLNIYFQAYEIMVQIIGPYKQNI